MFQHTKLIVVPLIADWIGLSFACSSSEESPCDSNEDLSCKGLKQVTTLHIAYNFKKRFDYIVYFRFTLQQSCPFEI